MSDTNYEVLPVILRDKASGEAQYTLEFNRESVKWAEAHGFKIAEVSSFLFTGVQNLFYFAFRMHHKGLPKTATDEILDSIGGASPELLERLVSLYNLPFETLIGDENTEKNSKYTVEL